jgi:glycosyltransferase involved in cell wall biosynthesis
MALPQTHDERGTASPLLQPLDILMLGPVSPPFGGVSMHVERTSRRMAAKGLNVGILNHYRSSDDDPLVLGSLRRQPFRYWWLTRRTPSRVVHYHHSRTSTLVAVALVSRRDPRLFVATVHGHSALWALSSRVPGVAALTGWGLRQFDHVVVVSHELRSGLASVLPADRITVLPAFVPPTRDELRLELLDHQARTFIEAADPLIVMSAYRVRLVAPSRDLWGLDLAVGTFIALAGRLPRARLAIFISLPPKRGSQRRHLENLRKRLAVEGLLDRVLFRFGASLLPALNGRAVLIRPTRSDGDSVSIREARAIGIPVVASDVVGRPPGVTTVPTERSDAFAEAIVIANHQRDLAGPVGDSDTVESSLLQLYGLADGAQVAGGAAE